MAYKVDNGWKCSYCGKLYSDSIAADSCRESHEILYIQISKTDLNRLINFIFTRDEKLISENLVKTLQRYARNAVRDSK